TLPITNPLTGPSSSVDIDRYRNVSNEDLLMLSTDFTDQFLFNNLFLYICHAEYLSFGILTSFLINFPSLIIFFSSSLLLANSINASQSLRVNSSPLSM